jgi:WD40 repeat protein
LNKKSDKSAPTIEEIKEQHAKEAALKKLQKNMTFDKIQDHVIHIEKLIHKGWITKIKYYPDLNYVISSSLDGMIHIHDIENLVYKENKTFNIH